IGELPDERLDARVIPPDYTGPSVLVAQGVVAGGDDVALRVPGAAVLGRLVDDSGAPLPCEYVTARNRSLASAPPGLRTSAMAHTDSRGRFWLLRLAPGSYDLDVPGHVVHGDTNVETGSRERTLVTSRIGRVLDPGQRAADGSAAALAS